MPVTATPTEGWDVIIVGAGPAGLSAGLILARCRRRVLLCDTGTPRSWAAHRMHGFLSQDGADLPAFRASAHEQVARYPNTTFMAQEVTRIEALADGGFRLLTDGEDEYFCRKVLLATGVFDEIPKIPGIQDYFGITAHPCPYCEGWEMQDRAVVIYGSGRRGFEMARAMTAWSSDLCLCTDGPDRLARAQRDALSANGIDIIVTPIAGVSGEAGCLNGVQFTDGSERHCDALFFDTPCRPQSKLAEQLGCRKTASGAIHCGQYEASSVPGVYAAGNILKDVQLSIVAAAEGARAAFGINLALTREAFERRALPTPHSRGVS